ncbi:MAG: TIM barrel protein [Sphaerochaetaceae bacterium]|nr:TIM barrel protein [Sphaerochaetaceae bacterium]
MNKKAISLVGFNTRDEIAACIEAYPEARFELAYNMDEGFLEEVAPLIAGRVVSLHACSPLEPYFPNFGSADSEVIEESEAMLMRSARTALRFGADIMVLHPGYLTDRRVSSNYAGRVQLMKGPEFQEYIGRRNGYIARKDILDTTGYHRHFSIMVEHVAKISERLREMGITLAVENLNPRAGYLYMQPDELEMFPPQLRFCLDVGHLWVSHFVFGFEFLPAVERMLGSGRVVSLHLHSNPSDGEVLEDSHDDFHAFGFPAGEIIHLAKDLPVNLVLETLRNPVENAIFLDELLALR